MGKTNGNNFNNKPAAYYPEDNKSIGNIPGMNRQKYNTAGFNRSLGTPMMGNMGQTKGTGDFFNNTLKMESK